MDETKDEVKAKGEAKTPATSKSKAKSKGKETKSGGFEVDPDSLVYLHGFGGEQSSEALEGALPKNITPQQCALGFVVFCVLAVLLCSPFCTSFVCPDFVFEHMLMLLCVLSRVQVPLQSLR